MRLLSEGFRAVSRSQSQSQPQPFSIHIQADLRPSTRASRTQRRLVLHALAVLPLAIAIAAVYVLVAHHVIAYDGPQPGKGPITEFVIPRGTSARITPITDSALDVPRQIAFGRTDNPTIVVRNEDTVPERAGPWIVQPGQSYRIRLSTAGIYEFSCTQNPSQSVEVIVNIDQVNGSGGVHKH
jgi:plastocyanin